MEGVTTQSDVIQPEGESFFARGASILEQARSNVVRFTEPLCPNGEKAHVL